MSLHVTGTPQAPAGRPFCSRMHPAESKLHRSDLHPFGVAVPGGMPRPWPSWSWSTSGAGTAPIMRRAQDGHDEERLLPAWTKAAPTALFIVPLVAATKRPRRSRFLWWVSGPSSCPRLPPALMRPSQVVRACRTLWVQVGAPRQLEATRHHWSRDGSVGALRPGRTRPEESPQLDPILWPEADSRILATPALCWARERQRSCG